MIMMMMNKENGCMFHHTEPYCLRLVWIRFQNVEGSIDLQSFINWFNQSEWLEKSTYETK